MIVVTKQYKMASMSGQTPCGTALREREILRYAGCRTEKKELVSLMRECLQEAEEADALNGQLCYAKLPLAPESRESLAKRDCVNLLSDVNETVCNFDCFTVRSEQLAKHLQGCSSVLLMAATAGVGIDRLIGKYGRLAPSKALMFQAIGAELIEAVCDVFSSEYEAEQHCVLRPRFSPGYGDLPLEVQKDIFAVLQPARRIGLTLNDSLLMSPSKSVTAFAGITDCVVKSGAQGLSECGKDKVRDKCENCDKKDCAYRDE